MDNSIFWKPLWRSLGWFTQSEISSPGISQSGISQAGVREAERSGAPLLAGNARFTNLSGKLLGAHVAI